MSNWPAVPLREVLSLDLCKEPIDSYKTYEMVGVLSYGRGLFRRPAVENGQTSYSHMLRLKAEHVVMSQLFGWEGALALSSAEFDGAYLSPNFPTFLVDEKRIDRKFLGWVMQWPSFWDDLGSRAKGMGDRRRTLNPEALFQSTIPLAPLPEQRAIVAKLDELSEKTNQLNAHLEAIEADADALLRSHMFGERADGYIKRKMSELVSLRSTDVAVESTREYRFAGVYSFGRGVFASAVKSGSDFAYERLSTVKAGDFTYPKLMAWEGALGIVPLECNGMVVSPEFPVFTVNTESVLPEVLDIYFRTPSVWSELAALSGGTNLRRRRLQPSDFLEYKMSVPPMPVQTKLRDLKVSIAALKAKHAAIRQSNTALVPATLERIFGEHRMPAAQPSRTTDGFPQALDGKVNRRRGRQGAILGA